MGAIIDDLDVGGLSFRQAEILLRRQAESLTPTLLVYAPDTVYSFSYPQIGFFDDISSTLSCARSQGPYFTQKSWFLKDEQLQLDFICDNAERRALDAALSFSSSGFSYLSDSEGVSLDRSLLKREVDSSLASGGSLASDGKLYFPSVSLKTYKTFPKITLSRLKRDSEKISEFSTSFNENDGGRVANIALAAAKIDGFTLLPDEEFSFNAVVGARTKENGFFDAKIISDGDFILGTGGGVCQVSTTLYNAAIKAGLTVTARKAHSLAVSYVPPSRDAMVSSYNDFRFRNDKSFPVFLAMKVNSGELTATIYGRNEGYRYEITEHILGEIPPPEPEEKVAEEEGVRLGRSGVKSEAYLETYRFGKLLSREKLHEDTYAPLRGIIYKKREKK
jgi:vancomycin resistance protein YoaR